MLLLDSNLVDDPAIHTYSHAPIFIWSQKGRYSTRVKALPNQPFGNQLVHLPLNFYSFLRIHSIGRFVRKYGFGNEVYVVLYDSFCG